jgi:hypothetical protein
MKLELTNRTKVLAGIVVLAGAGAAAWFLYLEDWLAGPPPAPVAASAPKPPAPTPAKTADALKPAADVQKPAADASKTTAAAKTDAKPPQADKSVSQATAAPEARTTEKLRPASGKYYSDKELKDLLTMCVFAAFSQEEQHKSVYALCEELTKLHVAGKEAEASKVMQRVAQLMIASGMLKQEKEERKPQPGQVSSKEQLAQTKPRAMAEAPAPDDKPRVAAPAPARAAALPPVSETRPGIPGPKYNDLMTAVLYRDAAAVNELIAFGRWADRPDSQGVTPLMAAAMLGDTTNAETLLKAGANPDAAMPIARGRNDSAMTALLERYASSKRP